jgi:hypothetical protein
LAVDFDHESRLMAIKVGDEGADRMLPTEAKAVEAGAP